MPLAVLCPSCRSSFKVAEEHAGKTTKCPKCRAPFKIEVGSTVRRESPPEIPVPAPPQLRPAKAKSEFPSNSLIKNAFSKGYRFPRWVTAAAVLLALTAGYFLGREHLRYELRALLSESGKAFSDGMKKSFAESFASESSEPRTAPETGEAAQPEPAPVKHIPVGDRFVASGFEVSIADARIEHAEIRNIHGETSRGTDPCLLISFRVKNTDDRKAITFQSYLDGSCTVHDDVGNQIRGISYGYSSQVIGQLRPEEEIVPGMEVTHVETFKVPLPKTERIVVTLNLRAFGGKGEALFDIPAASIQNFPK